MTVKIGYMCRIDFDHHIENSPMGTRIYPTGVDLLADHPCAEECGIIEVEVTLKRVVKESTF